MIIKKYFFIYINYANNYIVNNKKKNIFLYYYVFKGIPMVLIVDGSFNDVVEHCLAGEMLVQSKK